MTYISCFLTPPPPSSEVSGSAIVFQDVFVDKLLSCHTSPAAHHKRSLFVKRSAKLALGVMLFGTALIPTSLSSSQTKAKIEIDLLFHFSSWLENSADSWPSYFFSFFRQEQCKRSQDAIEARVDATYDKMISQICENATRSLPGSRGPQTQGEFSNLFWNFVKLNAPVIVARITF